MQICQASAFLQKCCAKKRKLTTILNLLGFRFPLKYWTALQIRRNDANNYIRFNHIPECYRKHSCSFSESMLNTNNVFYHILKQNPHFSLFQVSVNNNVGLPPQCSDHIPAGLDSISVLPHHLLLLLPIICLFLYVLIYQFIACPCRPPANFSWFPVCQDEPIWRRWSSEIRQLSWTLSHVWTVSHGIVPSKPSLLSRSQRLWSMGSSADRI